MAERAPLPRLVAAALLIAAAWGCTRPPSGDGGALRVDERAAPAEEAAPTPPAREPAPPAEALLRLRGRGEVRIGDAEAPVLRVEVARTAEERAQGLMFRRHLADDAGMVFDMERSDDWSFWMKNTLIPLDIIFIDARWRVVCVVANAAPETLQSRGCGQPSRWVLELAGGLAQRYGIAAGTPLRYRPLADAAAPQATP